VAKETAAGKDGAQQLAPELAAVHEAAEAALIALAAGEADSAAEARATEAAKAALDGGHALAVVAAAEQAGQRAARDRVRPQLLRDVERTAKRVRDVTREHEVAVVRAARAGLPDRQVAERAQIAHATVRSIVRRHDESAGRPPLSEGTGGGEDASPAPSGATGAAA
jgi:DNA-binding NarL/FixJ family response regulator